MTILEAPIHANHWPKITDLDRFFSKIEYGHEGEPTDRWEARALQHMSLPFTMKLGIRQEQTLRRFRVNRNCRASLARIFTGIEKLRTMFGPEIHEDTDIFWGCYLPGVAGPHSFGASIKMGSERFPDEIVALFVEEGWRQTRKGAGHFSAIS